MICYFIKSLNLLLGKKRIIRIPLSRLNPKQSKRSDFEIWIDQQRQVIYQDYYKQRIETEQMWKFELKTRC